MRAIRSLRGDCADLMAERDQLKTENNRLQSAANTLARIGYTDRGGELWKPPIGQKPNFDQIDHLRAEVAGLKTGYEAYERVNAELKAEVEALRSVLQEAADELRELKASVGFRGHTLVVLQRIDAAMSQGERP